MQRPDRLQLVTGGPKHTIAAIHVRTQAASGDVGRRTLLYSHGNAEDLGHILPYLDLMAQVCAADVFAYDYCGYGTSEGTACEENCYRSINAAYKYLVDDQRIPPDQIVAFGRSIGSGPTVDLVARTPAIRAMVLQSPIESAGRTVMGQTMSSVLYRMDIFRNYEKVERILCPVFVMHGTSDGVVPIENGRNIHAGCVNAAEPFWAPGRGHNNMPESTCMKKVREFLDRVYGVTAAGQEDGAAPS